MSKARDLADFVSAGSPLADGTISVSEVSGAAPTASPTFTGTVSHGDGVAAKFGTDNDLEIEHTGANSHIKSNSGYLYLLGSTSIRTNNAISPLANFTEGGEANLYYNGSEKIRTANTGVTVTGTVYTTNVDATTVAATTIEASTSLAVGSNDTSNAGILYLYGGATGEGGELRIYPSAAEDTVIDNWSIDVATDDLRFFTSAGTVAYQLAPTGAVSFGYNNYGTSGQVLTSGGSGAAPSWQSVSFTTNVITGNTTATVNNHYYLNGSAITLTLPASPSVGDEVRISEVAGNTDCVIGRNGSNIMSSGTDLTIDTGYTVIYLRYVDATIGWAFS